MNKYIEEFTDLISNCSMDNTYKMAWCRALVEYSCNHANKKIHFDKLSEQIYQKAISRFSKLSTFKPEDIPCSDSLLNNIITFKERKLESFELIRGLFSFYLICSLGAFTNVAIASYIFDFSSNWLISSFIGAVFGAIWNFTLTSIFTWKSK